MKIRNAGFTLVELAIVLVIIGLLIAGILAGKELIKHSVYNKQLAEWRSLGAASNAYYTKYNQIAGDDSKATKKFSGTTNGNGDGMLGADIIMDHYNYTGEIESCLFYEHLFLAGLWAFRPTNCTSLLTLNPGDNIPKLFEKDDLYYWVTNEAQKTSSFPVGLVPGEKMICTGHFNTGAPFLNQLSNMTPEAAYYIDSKLDDGKPLTGKIVAVSDGWPAKCTPKFNTISSNGCKNSAGEYDLTKTTDQCALSIKMGF